MQKILSRNPLRFSTVGKPIPKTFFLFYHFLAPTQGIPILGLPPIWASSHLEILSLLED